jgi:hypothetical protein
VLHFLTKLASSLGHCLVATLLFTVVFVPLHSLHVPSAPWISYGFPVGLYFGREFLDNNRNYYEALKASGLSGEQARKVAQGWRGWVPFWHWTLDGILDCVLPALTVLGLALFASLHY